MTLVLVLSAVSLLHQQQANLSVGGYTVVVTHDDGAVGPLHWSLFEGDNGTEPRVDVAPLLGPQLLMDVAVNGTHQLLWRYASLRSVVTRGAGAAVGLSLSLSGELVTSASPSVAVAHGTRLLTMYPAHPGIVRLGGAVRSTSVSPMTVSRAAIVSLSARTSEASCAEWYCPSEVTMLFHMGQRGHMPVTDTLLANMPPARLHMGAYPSAQEGTSQTSWLALAHSDLTYPPQKRHYGVHVTAVGQEFSGMSTALVGNLLAASDEGESEATKVLSVSSTIDALNYTLAPGATFETPAYFSISFRIAPPPVEVSDADFLASVWDEAGHRTQAYAAAHLYPKVDDAQWPRATWDSWAYTTHINETIVRANVQLAAAIGLEAVLLDLGWQDTLPDGRTPILGNWHADARKFPSGLRPLSDEAHNLGLKFGVHMALPQVNHAADVAKAHPEWIVPGSPTDYFGATGLCLCVPEAREWLAEQVVRLIDEAGLDMIKTDAEQPAKHCPGLCEDGNLMAISAFDELVRSVQARRPRVLWENCEGGGNMETYQMASMYHTSNANDVGDAYRTRQGAWQHTYGFSPRYTAHYMQEYPPSEYAFRSAGFGGPLILPQPLAQYDAAQLSLAKRMIAEYKAHREAFWRDDDAYVHHLRAPVGSNPAAAIDPTGGAGWDAIQVVKGDGTLSAIFVYRAPVGGDELLTLRPRGLAPAAMYTVSRASARGQGASASAAGKVLVPGADLMRGGLNVSLAPWGSDVVYLRRAPVNLA